MALTKGTGPFSPDSEAELYRADDGQTLIFDPTPGRIRARFADRTVADSDRVRMLHETGELPVYYFPVDDVDTRALHEDREITDPLKGTGRLFDLHVGSETSLAAAYRWNDPPEGAEFLGDFVAFFFHAVDAWLKEDEPIGVHPRDPYHRIEAVHSSRHVRVRIGDTVVAETRDPVMMFETSLPPRYYIPRTDIRQDLLVSSTTTTRCPYKGEASYWSVVTDERRYDDVFWAYLEPIDEVAKIAGMYSLKQHRDVLSLDVDRS